MSKPKQIWLGLLPFAVFILAFLVGIIMPLDGVRYSNYTSRVWTWTVSLIALAAAYYILRSKVLRWKELVFALIFGLTCFLALYLDGRAQTGMETGVKVAVIFYGGCRLFDRIDLENRSMGTGLIRGIKYFGLGAAISIPLALLNVLFFILQESPQPEPFFLSALFAMQPAVQEEVAFRFFLLAYGYHLMHGRVSERAFSVYIYLLMVVPHSLIHLPDQLLVDFGGAIVMLVITSLFFGLPMALLMKRKNLQMAAGMHWFIDFVRFILGY